MRKRIYPPQLSKWLLEHILTKYSSKATLGDLEEEFSQIEAEEGGRIARRWYRRQVYRSLPFCFSQTVSWSWAMISNYFKLAFRHIRRQKSYTMINLTGLSLGFACFILISLWVHHELSYDRFHEKRDRIFRILNEIDNGNYGASVSYALGPELERTMPEIEASCRVWPWARSLVSNGDVKFDEGGIYLTDPTLFDVFTLPFVYGNPETALADMNSIVITQKTAERYFGDDDPMGKVLHLAQVDKDMTVTGVVENLPDPSTLRFDLVARVEHLGLERIQRWEEWVSHSYVLLREGAEEKDVEEKMRGIYEKHIDGEIHFWPVLQPMTQVHLYAYGRSGLVKQVAIFSLIAAFILVIACINFMNLSTARSARRAREIGLRKVSGGRRSQLVLQFLSESLGMTILAFLSSLFLVSLALPAFRGFTGKALHLFDAGWGFLAFLAFVIVPVTGFSAGCYPAFVLSSFRPVDAFKDVVPRKRGPGFRRVLVILQFTISTALIIATIVVSRQLTFIREQDIGLDRHHVVVLHYNPDLQRSFDAFSDALKREQGIVSVTAAMARPTDVGQGVRIDWDGSEEEEYLVRYTFADYDFTETFRMQLLQGRSLSRDIGTDATEACIINESLMHMMGEESPVGKTIYFHHSDFKDSGEVLRVVGVVKDFHCVSMHRTIQPFLFRMYRPYYNYVFVRIDPADTQDALRRIERVMERFAPGYPFGYRFLDDLYEDQYRTENQLGQLFRVFGAFAVFISCLGLFGLAAYTTEQKTKEIGVRKVLGASAPSIVVLLSRELIRWVIAANLIAWPAAYFIMRRWLQEFAYRVEYGIDVFLLSASIAFVVALLTVWYQAIKAARCNPVEALRYE